MKYTRMYKALKAAQNEIHATLLKFTDDVVELNSKSSTSDVSTDASMSHAVQLLNAKQDVQFRVLNSAIDTLNQNMAKIVTLLTDKRHDTVSTDSTIPSLQPQASTAELKDVCLTAVPSMVASLPRQVVQTVPPLNDEDSLSEIEVEPSEQDVEEELEEVEEGDLEVEEWTYKGRTFFKDTDNTVYANDDGEVGSPIGTYDPVKNILKKLS